MQPSPGLSLHELHYNLGCILHQQGDFAGASQNYRQAIVLNPDYASAHMNLAVVLDRQGQRTQAIHHYQRAIALQPDYIKAYNNLGCALAKLGRLTEAIAIYQQGVERQPNWAVLHNNLGQTLARLGDAPGAIAAYRQAIRLQPDLGLAHHNLGKVLQSQGQHLAATKAFQRLLQLDPAYPMAQGDLSSSWLALGHVDRAIESMRAALGHQSELVQAFCDWTAQLEPQSSAHSTGDELIQARIACGRFLQLLVSHGDSAELKHWLAQTYFHLANTLMAYGGDGQYRQAEAHYQRALLLKPHSLDLYIRLGDCLVKQGRWNAATLTYHLALTHYPQIPQLYIQLGQALEKQQRFTDAIACYQQALRVQSDAKRSEETVSLAPIPPITNGLGTSALSAAAAHWRHQSQGLPDAEEDGDRPQGIYGSTLDWIMAHPSESATYVRLQLVPPDSTSAPVDPAASELATYRLQPLLHVPALPPSPLPPPLPQPVSAPTTCQGLNCDPCLRQLVQQFEPIHFQEGVHRCTLPSHLAGEPQSLFVATIPNGRIWAAPQQNDWLVCNGVAILTPDRYLLADVSRDYPGRLPGCSQPHPLYHRIFEVEELPPIDRVSGSMAVLTGLSGHNYYHWMVDILPRLELLRQSGMTMAHIDWFLINSDVQPFQRATLAQLEVPLQKLRSSDHHPHLQADQLIVPSFAGPLGWLEPWALTFLRRTFLPLAEQSTLTHFPERLYISRGKASHRRVLNEPAVIEQLAIAGFEVVHLESLALADQIALFSRARTIIAPHGGGLTNLIFCQPETTVVELMNPHYVRHYYWVISQQLRLNHYFVSGEFVACPPVRQLMYPSPLTEDLWITPTSLEVLLQTLKAADHL